MDDSKNNLEISVVLPIFQEKDSIVDHIDDLKSTLKEMNKKFEIIAVNDGSQDDTERILDDIKKENPDILQVIHHPYNKGNGEAIKTGIRNAKGEVIVCMDSDGQHDPKDLKKILPLIEEYDLVIGSRTSLYKGAWNRNIANKFYNWFASKLANFPILDLTSGYRVFRARAIKKFANILPSKFSYPTTSTLTFLKFGYNVKFVPVEVKARKTGKSKINLFRDGSKFFLIILKIIMIFEPLKVFLPISVLAFLLGMISSIFSIIKASRLVIPNSAVFLFLMSVLILLLGLVSEQIAMLQMWRENKNS